VTGAGGMMKAARTVKLNAGRMEPPAEKLRASWALKEQFRRTSVRRSGARPARERILARARLTRCEQVCAPGAAGGET
jgi:hypothetical protein